MPHRLTELAGVFLKLGTVSFGGPAAHIAVMEHEVVRRRGWLSEADFLDLFAATHLIPGPNAVEMASQVGYRRAGLRGSLVAGACFTVPAVLISAALAVAYVRYGSRPEVEPCLYGIKPTVLGIIVAALWRLGRKALNSWRLVSIGLGVVAASLLGADQVLALLVGTAAGALLLCWRRPGERPGTKGKAGLIAAATCIATARGAQAATAAAAGTAICSAATAAFPLWKLGLFFLKVGAVLYGGGYVLVAYLEGGLVGVPGGLTEQELLDAVAIGQLTPGPMLSTATFVGYLVARTPGAVVATLGMLLPCFVFVTAVHPWIPRLRQSRLASRFLDAVTAASLGLMAAVTITLGRATLVDGPSWLVAIAAAAVALRWKVSPAWLVLAGALAGRLLTW